MRPERPPRWAWSSALAALVGIALPVAASAGLLVRLAHQPSKITPIALAAPQPKCLSASGTPLHWTVGYQQVPLSLVPASPGYRFQGNSWLQADVCEAGTLALDADGEVADGEAPLLIVTLGDQVLASEAFNRRRQVRLNVSHAGRLRLAYLNDYYRADVRVAEFRGLKLSAQGTECAASVPVQATDSGAVWAAGGTTGSLTWAGPLRLRPCAAGKLEIEVQGHAARGEFPRVRFEQGGQVLSETDSTARWQHLTMNVAAGELQLSIVNPLNQTLADRNLNLRHVEFEAGPPSSDPR